jgi:hypothetical protein
LTGRERLAGALGGEGVAFVPYVWERLAEFVHQAAENWWRDGTAARRLLLDAASLARADGMVVGACGDALRAVADAGSTGADALDRFANSDEAGRAFALVEVLGASVPFAAVAWLPDLDTLVRSLGGGDEEAEEVAEDTLTDIARGFLEAGADAVLVMSDDGGAVRAAVARVAGVTQYYGRPLLGAGPDEAWVEGRDSVDVYVLTGDAEWPSAADGVVLTRDVSATWDADRLAALGRSRR